MGSIQGGGGSLKGVEILTEAELGYWASPIRSRRTKREMAEIREGLWDIVQVGSPMTVRQVFYRAVAAGLVGKTEAEYQGTVCRLLTEMRRAHELPYHWLVDNTRWMRKPSTYRNLNSFLAGVKHSYRKQIWNDQDAYVEIWLEKDALAGVLNPVTSQWDVPLMVTRGYPSLSYVHDAAETIAGQGKDAYIYYFGDHDPSGVDIPRKVEEDLRQFVEEDPEGDPDTEIHFERVAVLPEQIRDWCLPTRPTKKTDTRAKRFVGESVELDAVEPQRLRSLVEDRIVQHVDETVLAITRNVEASERAILKNMAKDWSA
jgi:hypothetical protein